MPSAEPVRRHAGHGQPGSQADEHRREGRRRLYDRQPQHQVRRHGQRDQAAREVHVRHHRSAPIAAFADENGNFDPALAPVRPDARRRRPLGSTTSHDTIKQQAAYIQDDIKAGDATFKLGLRVDHYDGLTTATLVQPRLGVSYAVPGSGTVLRASYGRTMETPYNENLLLSSRRRLERALRRRPTRSRPASAIRSRSASSRRSAAGWSSTSATSTSTPTTRYDFGVLFDTPIAFPVAWDHSQHRRLHRPRQSRRAQRLQRVRRDGAHQRDLLAARRRRHPAGGSRRATSASTTIRSSTRRRTCSTSFDKAHRRLGGARVAVRLGPGRRRGGQPRGRAGADRRSAGRDRVLLRRHGRDARRAAYDADCTSSNYGATRLRIPAEGTEDDVNNPPRIAPRHLFDLGIGVDNLLHSRQGQGARCASASSI